MQFRIVSNTFLAADLKSRYGPTDTFNWYIHDEDFEDKEFLSGLLSGLYDSDGWMSHVTVGFATASKRGADSVEKALRIFGMDPQRAEKKEKTGTVMYYANLREKGPITRFRDMVGFRIPRKSALLNKVITGFKDWKELVEFCAETPLSWPFRELTPGKVREILSLREQGLERKDTAAKAGVSQGVVDHVLTIIRQWGVIKKFDHLTPLGRSKVEKALQDHPYDLGFVVGAIKQKWSPKNKPKEIFVRTKLTKYHDDLVKALASCFGEPPKVWMNGEYFNISLSDRGIVAILDEMFGPFGEGVWDVDPSWPDKFGIAFAKGVIFGILSSKRGGKTEVDVTCDREEPAKHLESLLTCANLTGHLYCSGDTQRIKYSLRIRIDQCWSESCPTFFLKSASSCRRFRAKPRWARQPRPILSTLTARTRKRRTRSGIC